MEEELIQTAINRAYSSVERSTYKLLAACTTRVAKMPKGWYIGIFAPSAEQYLQLVDQLELLVQSLTEVMGSFVLGVCTQDDPLPPGGGGSGIVTGRCLIGMTWYYQISHESHPYWCQIAPEDLLSSEL